MARPLPINQAKKPTPAIIMAMGNRMPILIIYLLMTVVNGVLMLSRYLQHYAMGFQHRE